MSSPAPLGGFRALALGFRSLRRHPSLALFAAAVAGALAVCRVTLLFALGASFGHRFLAGLSGGDDLASALGGAFSAAFSSELWLPILGAWAVLELLDATLRAFVLGAAVVNLSGALVEPPRPRVPLAIAAMSVLPRAVLASVWLGLLDVAVATIRAVLFICAVILIAQGFRPGASGLGGSLAGALGISLAVTLALVLALFGRAYRVVALRRLELSAYAAMWEAAKLVGARLGALLLLEVLGLALVTGGSLVAAGPGGLAAMLGSKHLLAGLSLRVLAALLVAAWSAAVDLALVGGVCALDLDTRGELPPPPTPAPLVAQAVLVAEPVLIAQAVDPEPTPGS